MAQPQRFANLIPLAAVHVAGTVCGLIGIRWLSAVVSPETMGLYGLLLSTQQLAPTVTHQGLIKHVQRFWTPHTSAKTYLKLLSGSFLVPLGWLAIGLIGMVVLLNLTSSSSFGMGWWSWMMLVNLLTVISMTAQAALQAEQRYWANFGVSALGSAARSFLPALLATLTAGTLVSLGTGFSLHALLLAAAALWCLCPAWTRTEANAHEVVTPPGSMLSAFMWVGLCGWLAATAPRWFAAVVLPPETTGYFIVATNIATLVPAATSLIGLSYSFPPLFEASRQGVDRRTMLRMTGRTLAIVMIGTQLGLFVIAWCLPLLIGVVIDARYTPAADWILSAGGGVLATISAPFLCNLLIAQNRERSCLWLSIASASLRVAFIASLAAVGRPELFRLGLSLLAWPTVLLEWLLVRYWLRDPARTSATRADSR